MKEHVDDLAGLPALGALREGLQEVASRDARSRRRRQTRHVAAGLAGLALIVGAAAVMATRSDDTQSTVPSSQAAQDLIEPQTAAGFVSGGPEYETLDQLVASSELVVAGTVKEVRSGGEIVDIDPQYPTRFLHTVIAVDEVMKGSTQRGEVTVRTIETAYAPTPGDPSGIDMEWRKAGTRIVAFLAASPSGGSLLVPTSPSQSFYRLRGANVAPLGARPEDATHSIPVSQLRQAVRAASGP